MEKFDEFFKTETKIYPDTIICADTEVSSYWIDDAGNILEYDKTLSDEFYNSCEKGCCLYIWQISIDDAIYYGREIADFGKFCDELERRFIKKKEKDKIKIFFHNLAYDFAVLLRNLWNYDFDDVFARTIGKPMKATKGNIEFRCSYMMTNLSLASWGKELGINKLSGQKFNYHKLRTPKTELTEDELAYCSRDIEVMIAGIKKLLAEYGTIDNIPLTNTGQVRREYKEVLKKNVAYKRMITRTLPKTVEEFNVRTQVFGGGDTHGNLPNIDRVLYDIGSDDECSAYIGVMFRYKFPKSPFCIVSNRQKIDYEKYSYIFLLKLDNVRLKKNCTLSYISKSRCISVCEGLYDNGRVSKAKQIVTYATEYDFEMMKRIYDFELEILVTRRSRKDYLNTDFVETLLDFFYKKTTLKGVAGYEDLYMKSKNRLNASFGCMVMNPVQPKIEFNGDWVGYGQLEQDVQSILDNLQNKWWNNYFSYDVGLFITSISRFVLWEAITRIADYKHDFRFNDDVCYFDTDSVKHKHHLLHRKVFEEMNAEIIKQSEEACKHHGFSYDVFRPKKPNGEESILGLWEYEGNYQEAVFLGAKKYCVREKGKLEITVSGVPKRAAICLHNDIRKFKDGFVFDREVCRKSQSAHLNGNNPIVTLPDGYTVNQPFGINIRNCGYTLGLTQEFKQMVDFMREHGEI